MISGIVGLFTRRVSATIGSGFLLLVILLICCAGTGYYGMYRLGKILSFISGPAWSNADSIMNGVIKTEGQLLAVRKLLSGSDPIATKIKIAKLGVDAAAAEVAPLQQNMGFLVLFFVSTSIIVSAMAATLCTRTIVHPIAQVMNALAEFGEGNLTRKLSMTRTDKLGKWLRLTIRLRGKSKRWSRSLA